MRRIWRTDGAILTHLGLASIAQMRQSPKLKQRLIID
jgi:hypothetical protein